MNSSVYCLPVYVVVSYILSNCSQHLQQCTHECEMIENCMNYYSLSNNSSCDSYNECNYSYSCLSSCNGFDNKDCSSSELLYEEILTILLMSCWMIFILIFIIMDVRRKIFLNLITLIFIIEFLLITSLIIIFWEYNFVIAIMSIPVGITSCAILSQCDISTKKLALISEGIN